jgi:multisubunit Na+/H+ antiporter MnhC subunit
MREHDGPDPSGSTAQFRAFVDRSGGPEATQAWSMKAPRNRVAMLTAIVIGAAVVLALIAFAVIG